MTDERLPQGDEWEEEENEETPTPTPPPAASDEQGPKGLRQKLSRVEKENKALREQVMTTHLDALGLRADTGLGKAIFKEYTGDFSLEAVRQYAAEEYGHDSGTVTTEFPEVVTADRIASINAVTTSVIPPPPVDQAAEVTAKMHDPEAGRPEAEASINAKLDQFAKEHYPHAFPKQ